MGMHKEEETKIQVMDELKGNEYRRRCEEVRQQKGVRKSTER